MLPELARLNHCTVTRTLGINTSLHGKCCSHSRRLGGLQTPLPSQSRKGSQRLAKARLIRQKPGSPASTQRPICKPMHPEPNTRMQEAFKNAYLQVDASRASAEVTMQRTPSRSLSGTTHHNTVAELPLQRSLEDGNIPCGTYSSESS